MVNKKIDRWLTQGLLSMFNEKDVNELERWDVEYSTPDVSVFLNNLVQSPLGVGSKALNVGESLAGMVAQALPSGKLDEEWGLWVMGSRLVSLGLSVASHLTIASHKSGLPLVSALSKWHSLWCSPFPSPIPSNWKLIMEAGEDSKYGMGSHIADPYVKSFITSIGEDLKSYKDTEILSMSPLGLRYRLKESERAAFQVDTDRHPFSDEPSPSMLLMISPSREVAIINTRGVIRVVGSESAYKKVYKSFTQQVMCITNGGVEVYKFSDGMNLTLSDFSDQQGLTNELVERIRKHPNKLAFLAIGKPGTGKTQFSMCLAKEILIEEGYVVMVASVSELISFRPPDWMKKVAIICNDADLLLLSRESNLNRWGSMALGDIETCMQLLDSTLSRALTPVRINDVHFDESEQTSMVYVITSNIQPENIDTALMRPGRVDIKGVFTKVYDK